MPTPQRAAGGHKTGSQRPSAKSANAVSAAAARHTAQPAALAHRAHHAPASLSAGEVQQLQRKLGNHAVVQLMSAAPPRPAPPTQLAGDRPEPLAALPATQTGLPDSLKTGVEALSGLSLDRVRVHYNSSRPAQLQALAYTQGTHIHVAPGQDQHLPHEAWHVVQQVQGRVRPTMQLKEGVPLNDDQGLEHEADVMGAKAAAGPALARPPLAAAAGPAAPVVQGRLLMGARRNPEEVTWDILTRLVNEANDIDDHLTNELYEKYFDDTDWLVLMDGSMREGSRRGFWVRGFEEIVRRPAIAGMGNLELVPSTLPAGFAFAGRPGWTREVVAAVETAPGLENIRHVIPYHIIRSQFENYLNERFVAHHNNQAAVLADLQALAMAVGADDFEADDRLETIKGLAINILSRLNSVPGNLWAGSAVENQRLNSLRIRLENIIAQLAAGEIDQNGVIAALQESARNARAPVYRELILGVLRHLPRPGDANFKNRALWIDRLKLAAYTAEVDVFPSREELAEIHDPEQMLRNMPELFDIFHDLIGGRFVAGARRLANIPSPHPPVDLAEDEEEPGTVEMEDVEMDLEDEEL